MNLESVLLRRLVVVLLIVSVGALSACGAGSVSDRVDQAQQDMAQKKYRSAQVRLKTVLRKHPDNGQAWLLLAQTSVATFHYADAAHQFQQAADNGQASDTLQVDLIRAQIAAGDYQAALANLDKIPGDSPVDRLERLVLRGNALSGLQKSGPADDAYGKALSIDAGFTPALIGRADLAAAAGRTAQARELLDKAAAHDADNPAALRGLATLDYQANRCDAAIPGFERALSSKTMAPSETYKTRVFLADCQLREDKLDSARDNIAQLTRISGNNPYTYYLQALLGMREGQYEQASTALRHVLDQDPGNVRSLTLLAWLSMRQDRPADARALLGRALARSPDDVGALQLQASAYAQNDQPAQALDSLKKAYRAAPDAPGVRERLASAMAGLDARPSNDDTAQASARDDESGKDMALQLDLVSALVARGDSAAAATLLAQIKPASDADQLTIEAMGVRLALASGSTDRAVQLAKALALKHPDDADVQQLLAVTYISGDDLGAAAQVLSRTHKAHPANIGLARMWSQVAAQIKQYSEAIAALKPLTATHPENADLRLQLASVYAAAGDQAAVVSSLESANKQMPDNAQIVEALSQAYLRRGSARRAVDLTTAYQKAHADNAQAMRMLGVAQLASSRPDEGLMSLEKAAALAPDQPAYRLDLAQAQLASGNVKASLATLRALRQSAPDFLPAFSVLARAQVASGDVNAALATADALGKAGQPQAADVLSARLLAGEKRVAQAAQRYQSAFNRNSSAMLAIALYSARQEAGQPDAIRSLVDWHQRFPSEQSVTMVLASAYQQSGDLAQAAQLYRSVVDQKPDSVAALNNLAVVRQLQDRPDALGYAKRAYELAPDNTNVADTYGWLLVQGKRYIEALPLLEKAASSSDDAQVQYHLGVALASAPDGDRARARTLLEAAIATGLPKLEQARARALISG